MQRKLTTLVVLIFVQFGFAQNKAQVDSINQIIVHEIKIPLPDLVELFKQNIADAERINYTAGKAEAYYNLSLAYSYKGDSPDKSAEAILTAIRIYESLENKEKMAKLYGQLGYGMKRRDLIKAMGYMQKGIAIAQTNQFENELKDLYNNYGVLKQWNNELDSAAYYFEAGLNIKRKLKDDFGIPYSLSNLAGAYLAKENHQKAADLLEESIALRIKLEDSTGLGENFTQLAEVYYSNKQPEKALDLFKQSTQIAIQKEYIQLEQFNYEHISKIYQEANQADSALHYFQKYIEIKDKMFTDAQEATIAELTIAYETEKKELALAESELKIQRKNLLLTGTISGLFFLGLIAYLVYKQQRTKNHQLQKEMELKSALAKIETQNRLEEQRIRISRDLHDNIGSQLTFVISGLQYIQYQKQIPAQEVKSKVEQIANFTQQTIHELRDTIWAMNKEQIILSDLINRLNNFINQLAINEVISISVADNLKPKLDQIVFTALEGIHIYRILQEAINNAIKHAEANSINIYFNEVSDVIEVQIKDDGIGFAKDENKQGNGLKNMYKRAKQLGAHLTIETSQNSGTTIQFNVDIKANTK